MKKISALTIIILMLLLLSGCGSQETPEINYTAEILINEEAPPKDLVWYADLQAPTAGISVLEGFFTSYRTYATVSPTEILPIVRRDYRDIIDAKAPFEDNFFEKVTFFFNRKLENQKHDYRLKILGMTEEEHKEKINKYFNLSYFHYYPDRVIGIVYPNVSWDRPEEQTGAEYANQIILVDYDYKTSAVIPYTDEELMAAGGGNYFSSYEGRIGECYYLPYGYYDLRDRALYPYTKEDDLPPVQSAAEVKDSYSLKRLIENDADAAAHIPDFHYVVSYTRIGDRYYAIVAQRNRYYGNSIEDYDGENVFLVTVDAVTEKVIYLQKYHIENYWGYEYRLFTLGEDGILYDPMIP
jgi:hypothetical protein